MLVWSCQASVVTIPPNERGVNYTIITGFLKWTKEKWLFMIIKVENNCLTHFCEFGEGVSLSDGHQIKIIVFICES